MKLNIHIEEEDSCSDACSNLASCRMGKKHQCNRQLKQSYINNTMWTTNKQKHVNARYVEKCSGAHSSHGKMHTHLNLGGSKLCEGSDVRATHQRGRGQGNVPNGGFQLIYRGHRHFTISRQRFDLDLESTPVVFLSFRLIRRKERGLSGDRP